jgi:hypothetical protein
MRGIYFTYITRNLPFVETALSFSGVNVLRNVQFQVEHVVDVGFQVVGVQVGVCVVGDGLYQRAGCVSILVADDVPCFGVETGICVFTGGL